MHGLCVMQGSTVLFFAEGGGGMLGFGFNQTIIYAKFLFLIVGEEQSAMERTVQESQPSHSSTRKTRRCRKCKQPMRGHTREKCQQHMAEQMFSLPYYFFINFWFLNIQGTFSTFMFCFVELWSPCYSFMYKYDSVFP